MVPVAVASLHGLVDVDYVLRPDLYVAYAAAWLVPACLVSPLFFVASIRHFALDVGALPSVVMHITWSALSLCGRARVAWCTFVLYYCLVHVGRWGVEESQNAVRKGVFGLLCMMTWMVSPRNAADFFVRPHHLKMVIGHVLLNEKRLKDRMRA